MSQYTDGVDHPQHYNAHPAGIECIDVVEHFGFNIGNAMKYLWRAGLKPGEDMIKDLEKACWYVQREIERLKKRAKKEDRVIKNALVTCEIKREEISVSGVQHRKNNWGPIPPEPESSGRPLKISDIRVGKLTHKEWQEQHANAIFSQPINMDLPEPVMIEVAKEPAKKLRAALSGTSEADTATTVNPIAEKSAAASNSNSPQKPCKDCGEPYDRSDWYRFNGICAACRKMQRDKALADKIAKLNEADVRIGPDRNKPEPPKETMNKLVSADYLLKRLQHDYPAKGEFLVEDAMKITDMPFRDTVQLLQIIGEERVKPISPAELKSQQKWKLVKEAKC